MAKKCGKWTEILSCMIAGLALCLILPGCSAPSNPLVGIARTYKDVPTYSVVLDDMREEGNFFKTYFHKYRVVTPEAEDRADYTTDWVEVPKSAFQQYLPFLGMTIFTKQDGKPVNQAGPPGYEYVGNSRYGEWQRGSTGQSFWVWYGQYALISRLLGPGPIYRNDWNTYRTYRNTSRPYYGPNKGYGTNGGITRTQKPNFFARRQSAQLAKKASFSKRVGSRVGRTRYSSRGRSGRVGK